MLTASELWELGKKAGKCLVNNWELFLNIFTGSLTGWFYHYKKKNHKIFDNLHTNIHASRVPSGEFCYFLFGAMGMGINFLQFPPHIILSIQTSYILNGVVAGRHKHIELLRIWVKKYRWEQAKVSLDSSLYRLKFYRLKIELNSLAVQWLGLHAFTAEGAGSIPGGGTKIPQATRCGQKKKIELKFNWKKEHIPKARNTLKKKIRKDKLTLIIRHGTEL